MRSRLRPTRRLVALVFLAGALVGGVASRPFATDAGGASPPPAVHIVREGETLWGLARRRSPEADPRRYIREVLELNGLQGAGLVPGQRLVLPPG